MFFCGLDFSRQERGYLESFHQRKLDGSILDNSFQLILRVAEALCPQLAVDIILCHLCQAALATDFKLSIDKDFIFFC